MRMFPIVPDIALYLFTLVYRRKRWYEIHVGNFKKDHTATEEVRRSIFFIVFWSAWNQLHPFTGANFLWTMSSDILSLFGIS